MKRRYAIVGVTPDLINGYSLVFMYWDIKKILPYQRNFNFINGARSIGKTYTTEKYCIEKAIEDNVQIVYLVRYVSEREQGALPLGFDKVITNEFNNILWRNQNDVIQYKNREGEWEDLIICIAISEAQKIKKRSFPRVKYIIFDEYMLEKDNNSSYVKGWREPELFLNIYHTIDREEDRVICFMLGNTTTLYNPYHLHPAFNIPSNVKPGQIWYNKFCLFQWALPDNEMLEKKSQSKFNEMIESTQYGKYASEGVYIEDNEEFIAERTESAKHLFLIKDGGIMYGVWFDYSAGIIYIDEKYDPYSKLKFVFSNEELTEGFTLASKSFHVIKWLSDAYKKGCVKYASMEIKKKLERIMYYLS